MDKYEISQAIEKSKNLPELISRLKDKGIDSLYYDWAMRMFLDFRARKKAVPLKGVFELTPLCNFDCKMCYVHLDAAQLKNQKLISAEAWQNVMSQAIDNGMMYATLTGGECLTYPDFKQLYLFLYNRSVQISVLTNGALLDGEMIDFLKNHRPFSVQVTLYGADEDMYEKVTGKREFKKVTDNLKNADKALLPLNITVTPNQFLSKEEIEKTIRLAATFNTSFRVNSALITPRSQTERNDGFNDLSVTDYIDFIKLELALKGELPQAECEIDLPKEGGADTFKKPKGLRCGGGRSVFNITWDGKMVPCNRLTHISSDPFADGFTAAWKEINGRVNEYLLPVECEGCAYRYAARGCAAAHSEAKVGHASPTECEWCREMVKNSLAKTVDN